MRLAQVMAGARLGGIELFFERLTPALAEHGHEVVSIIRRNPARAAKLRAAGVEVSELPFGGYFDLLTWGRLRRLLQGFKPEVVIGWSNRANRFIPNGPWVRVGRPGGYYNLKYYKDCDHIAYTTHSLVRWAVEQGWPRQRAHRVPNFVDDPAGTPPASRSSLGVPEGVPLALAMGRLHRNKGFDTLLNAVARLPELHLLLAGEGPEDRALRRHAANLGISGRDPARLGEGAEGAAGSGGVGVRQRLLDQRARPAGAVVGGQGHAQEARGAGGHAHRHGREQARPGEDVGHAVEAVRGHRDGAAHRACVLRGVEAPRDIGQHRRGGRQVVLEQRGHASGRMPRVRRRSAAWFTGAAARPERSRSQRQPSSRVGGRVSARPAATLSTTSLPRWSWRSAQAAGSPSSSEPWTVSGASVQAAGSSSRQTP
ncbi:MAG: glycosyltransferase [Acetobacteraceae bacterium]|nr:glycosyltransferase [Acetobacteraceae bacterium]